MTFTSKYVEWLEGKDRRMRNPCSITALIISLVAAPLYASEPLRASQVSWKEHFGQSTAATNTLFCLMAHGYFHSETTNVQSVIVNWITLHPKAMVIPVITGGPVLSKVPNSKQAFVWVVQGADMLNVELVRQGCLAPETQMLNLDESPHVPQADYEKFVRNVVEAGDQAKKRRLGIWRSERK